MRLDDIQDAAMKFVEKLKPTDSVMVMSFDDRIQVQCKATTDRDVIQKAIRHTHTGGGTRLYDAVDDILRKQLQTITGRKAVVLFTDGVDTASHRASYDSTIRLAEESDAPIYSVDYDTSELGGGMGGGIPLPGGRGRLPGLPLPRRGAMPGGGPGSARAPLPARAFDRYGRPFLQWRLDVWNRAGFCVGRRRARAAVQPRLLSVNTWKRWGTSSDKSESD